VFNALLIARAPLQLFQAIQTSILPHLTRLAVRGESDPFRRSIQTTLAAIAVSPAASRWRSSCSAHADEDPVRRRPPLRPRRPGAGGRGHGFYLSAATLNQAALARGKARHAAAIWLATAATFWCSC